jgi:hypothetical protein
MLMSQKHSGKTVGSDTSFFYLRPQFPNPQSRIDKKRLVTGDDKKRIGRRTGCQAVNGDVTRTGSR